MTERELKLLQQMAREYPTVQAASAEIINLTAILNLPKGTEHFMSDIHGEHEAFLHILNNGSGAVAEKIQSALGDSLTLSERRSLAALIYYPKEKLREVKRAEIDMEDWYRVTLKRLISVCRQCTTKYSRSKVRKALPREYAYIMEEMLNTGGTPNKERYYDHIIRAIVDTGSADTMIEEMATLIKRMTVDELHIVGDIFDRGPHADVILDHLMTHHHVDVQWGNHDVLWMGAAAGNTACIANVLRISAKYGNLNILEDGYGINLVPLARLAMTQYADDPCKCFSLDFREEEYDVRDAMLDEKMHKAISIIQFKLEGQLIEKHPEFHMEDRRLLHQMDLEKGTVVIEGVTYPLKDKCFPTIDPKNPYQLTAEENDVVERLKTAFVNCERLQKHVRFLLTKGSLYKVYNGNLLYHGCVPLNEDGTFTEVDIYGEKYSGKELYDVLEHYVRKGYYSLDKEEKKKGLDIFWFIWENKNSPVFGKQKMTTFERYFVADKKTHVEPKNPYYRLLEKEEIVNRILAEFGLHGEECHIINGHIPVESKKGESPIKCNGKLLIIDGGFSKAYQGKAGIAGYTLIYNSYGLVIAAHEPFESVEKAVQEGRDVHSHRLLVEHVVKRKTVADTDVGRSIQENIRELEKLLQAYREGAIVENA